MFGHANSDVGTQNEIHENRELLLLVNVDVGSSYGP